MLTSTLALVFMLAQISQPATKPPSASIEGFVRRVGTGEPVAKARIMLGGGPPATQATGPKIATSDKYGHFIFVDLAAGRYTLQGFANDYVRQTYGQKAQNQPGTPVILADDQQVKDIVFEMTPTGTITGRIYDFDNAPLPNSEVVLQKLAYDVNGQRTFQVVQQTRTNDLGEYRIFWITPGKYLLQATFSGSPTPGNRNPNEFIGPTEAGYAPVYYPGTSDLSSASEIEVLPGLQMSAIDITLIRTRTYAIKGRAVVTVATGGNQRPFVTLRPAQPSSGITSSTNTSTNADGTFEVRNVPPGSYLLEASVGSIIGSDRLQVQRPLEVKGDMEGVVINVSAGFTLPCRLIFEGTPPSSMPNMRPTLFPMGDASYASAAAFGGVLNPPKIQPDGTFAFSNVPPGSYRIQLQPLPPDYYIKAVSLNQSDALRAGIAVDHTPDSPVEILLSPNAGKIGGTVVDQDGKPVSATQVTLIPNDQTRTEAYKVSGSDLNGQFSFSGVIPGAYRLFAWEVIEPNAYRDPEFIRQYENQGKNAAIVEGSNPSVELRVIKAP